MAIDWLKDLRKFAELGRCRYEERLSEIDGLPRGQFLRHKRELLDEPSVSFYRSTTSVAEPAAANGIGPLPDELEKLLAWSDGLANSTALNPILEIQIFGAEDIRKFRIMGRQLVYEDGLFPPVFTKLLAFGNDYGRRHLAVWAADYAGDSPVLLVDTEQREILIVSYSLDLFFQRVSFSIASGIPFRIESRSKQLRNFISESEPGPVYPPKAKGKTLFFFDKVEDFPSSWQSLLSDDDRSSRLD